MSASRDGTFHPAVAPVICVGGVCVSVCNCAPGKITQYATERSALCPYVFYLSLALLSLHTVWICAVFFYFSPRSSIRLLWICENRDDVEHDTRACQFV